MFEIDPSDNKVEVFEDTEDYVAQIEYQSGFPFVHITLKTNKISAAKKVRKRFHLLKTHLFNQGYSKLFSYTQNKKYAESFPGAKHLTHFEHNNSRYEVYEWELSKSPLLP
jgi:hypothetical protein